MSEHNHQPTTDATPIPAKSADEVTFKAGGVTIPFKALAPYALVLLVGGGGGNLMGQLTGTTQLREDVAKLTSKVDALQKDIEELSFNTAISQMMILVNEIGKQEARPRTVIKPLIQCLAPFAPHFAEELWEKLGESRFVSTAPWPTFDAALTKS